MRKLVLFVGLLGGAAVLLLLLAGSIFNERNVQTVLLESKENSSLPDIKLSSTAPYKFQEDIINNTTENVGEDGQKFEEKLDFAKPNEAYESESEVITEIGTAAITKRSLLLLNPTKDAIITWSQTKSKKLVSRMIEGCRESSYDRLINEAIKAKKLSQPIKNGGVFDNPFSTWKRPALGDVASFVLFEPDHSGVPKDSNELDRILPVLKPDFQVDPTQQGKFKITWIGHSTVLIQVDGVNILTDPVFSNRASFTQFVGPKRIRPPPCQISELPPIHIVLVSHNHYDHLDSDSVSQINDRFGRDCKWIVPLGLGEYLDSMSVSNYVELDWWQKDCFSLNTEASKMRHIISMSFENAYLKDDKKESRSETENESDALQIYLTPAQHWCRRWVADYNKSLWGSFVVINKQGSKFFFAGDTGYCTAFKEIGDIFGSFAGAAIPIGAYHPRSFLKYAHVDPQEAVKIHQDIKSEKSFAIHHSTFILSYEPYREPAKLLNETIATLREEGQQPKPFFDIKHGQSIYF